MRQVKYETSMKNIPLGGKKEYVADDPSGETGCSTHGIDSQLVILSMQLCYTQYRRFYIFNEDQTMVVT